MEDQIADVQDDADPDASVNKLLRLLRSHTDRKAAISAALKAVMTLPSRKVVPAEDPAAIEASPPVSEPPMEPIPDPESFLDSFLRCKHLVETFRANPSTHNKTPLAILHEYATRLGLEVCSCLTMQLGFLLSTLRKLRAELWCAASIHGFIVSFSALRMAWLSEVASALLQM